MSMTFPQFVGSPCGQHGPYTFYKAFKYQKTGKLKILTLGEFFFVRISPNEDPCIGELQLLWEDRNREQVLSSMRLYFLPEQTPDGRLSHHGDHEVLAVSEKVVLKLSDLVEWIMDGDEVDWSYGLLAACDDDVTAPIPDVGLPPQTLKENKNLCEEEKDLVKMLITDNNSNCESEKEEMREQTNTPEVIVLPYPRYCRYRAALKRLENTPKSWLKNILIIAVGGFTMPGRNTFILFCRDTFDHEGLVHNDLNCDHLAPSLKGRPRKKTVKIKRSTSPDSESNTSEENREIISTVTPKITLKNGFKKPACKDEQEFLQSLFKFMKNRNTPIHRVPHLGFKQIDLYFFYMYAQKLGGYERITYKKMWKHVYDELGGNPGSTSAATCTRRHYERLLLPFERFMNGNNEKELPPPPPPRSRNKKEKLRIKQENGADNVLKLNSDADDSTDGSQDEQEHEEILVKVGQNGDFHEKDVKYKMKELECFEKEWKDIHRSLHPNKHVGDNGALDGGYKRNEMKRKNITQSWVSGMSKHSLPQKYHPFQEQENKPPMSCSVELSKNNVLDCKSQFKPVTSIVSSHSVAPYVRKIDSKDFSHHNSNRESPLSKLSNGEGVNKHWSTNRTGRLPVRDSRIASHYSVNNLTSNISSTASPSISSAVTLYSKFNKYVTSSQYYPVSNSRCCSADVKSETRMDSHAEVRHQPGVSIMSPLYRKSQAPSLSTSSITMSSNRYNRLPISNSNASSFPMPVKTSAVDVVRTADTTHRNLIESKETKSSQRRPSVIQHTEHIQTIASKPSSVGVCNTTFSQHSNNHHEAFRLPLDKTSCCRSTELIIPRVGVVNNKSGVPLDTTLKFSPKGSHYIPQRTLLTDVSRRNNELSNNRTCNLITNHKNHISITDVSYKQQKHPVQSSLRTDMYFHPLPRNVDHEIKSSNNLSHKFPGPFYDHIKRGRLRPSPPPSSEPVMSTFLSHKQNYNYYSSPSFFSRPSNNIYNCDDEVLDLSMKKKPQPIIEENSNIIVPVSPVLTTNVTIDGECLDLSLKKNTPTISASISKNTDLLRGIEDITPPPPPCTESSIYQNNLKFSTECNRHNVTDSIVRDNCVSVHSNHLKLPVTSNSDITVVQSPLTYKLRGSSKAVCVSEYNPRLPSFITPPFYPFSPTSWTSPHYSATGNITVYKELIGQGTIAESQQHNHIYPFMYNDGCVYQTYTK